LTHVACTWDIYFYVIWYLLFRVYKKIFIGVVDTIESSQCWGQDFIIKYANVGNDRESDFVLMGGGGDCSESDLKGEGQLNKIWFKGGGG
jgi:hypothetical protein